MKHLSKVALVVALFTTVGFATGCKNDKEEKMGNKKAPVDTKLDGNNVKSKRRVTSEGKEVDEIELEDGAIIQGDFGGDEEDSGSKE